MADQMVITLTRARWDFLRTLVREAARSQRVLGVPLEIVNGDQKIEIEGDGSVTITLDG